jgi:hypothetical protein
MYLTYAEYIEYGGTLDETTFQDLEYDAEVELNWYTFNRLKREEWKSALNSTELKRCVYQLIRLKRMENDLISVSTGGAGVGGGWKKEAGITRESNDGVTTEYNTMSSGDLMAYFNGSKTKADLVNKYLNSIVNELGRKLLYRGIYPGE